MTVTSPVEISSGVWSYQTSEDITNFFKTRLGGEAWVACTDKDLKDRCNVTAADILNTAKWRGDILDPNQPLAWHRINVLDSKGIEVPCDMMPEAVLFAHMRVTLALFEGRLLPSGAGNRARVKKLSAEGVNLEFTNPEGVILHGDGTTGQTITTNWLEVAGDEIRSLLLPRTKSLIVKRA